MTERATVSTFAVGLFLALLGLSFLGGCSSTAVGLEAAIKVRDLTCTGGRLVCRITDRVCRTGGGPWVVPRTDAERAEDRAAGAFGEITGTSGGDDATPAPAPPSVAPAAPAPPASAPMPATSPTPPDPDAARVERPPAG